MFGTWPEAGRTVLWAALSGGAVIALHSWSAGLGARLGAYRTGTATLVVFALAAGVALRKYIVRLWPRRGWKWVEALTCASPNDSLKPVLAQPPSGVPLLTRDWQPKTWRRVHVTLGILATLPLWWHCESGRASPLDLTLKSVAILLVMSGLFGLAIIGILAQAHAESTTCHSLVSGPSRACAIYRTVGRVSRPGRAVFRGYMNTQMASIVGASAAAALLLLLLAPRSDYEPGVLLAAHRQLSGDCTTCHRPWHGPLNDNCVGCHGNLRDENRHSGLDVSQTDIGLIAGRTLVVSATGTLECLSCHGEHEGAAVEVKAAASLACTWCHKHPTIGKVAAHLVPSHAAPVLHPASL